MQKDDWDERGPRFSELGDVHQFMNKMQLPVGERPQLLPPPVNNFRVNRMFEELAEFSMACREGDLEGAADALVDLEYFLKGTVLLMGLPWTDLWARVHEANMAKRPAHDATESRFGFKQDVIKPEGWQPPRHWDLLGLPCPTCGATGFENGGAHSGPRDRCAFCLGEA